MIEVKKPRGASSVGCAWIPTHNLYRGYLSGLPAGNYGTCINRSDPDDTDGECPNTDIPDPGNGLYPYLATASVRLLGRRRRFRPLGRFAGENRPTLPGNPQID